VRVAYAQLGDPYRWGAGGPGAFDCSGLTSFAWRAAGVSLPHSSAAQYGSGRRVSRSDLRPGDLVFFYSPISHVGIYVGGGKMIDAPYPGSSVKITSISSMPYVGAVRP
jgi:cell wall-associated NlpC family hydrolase